MIVYFGIICVLVGLSCTTHAQWCHDHDHDHDHSHNFYDEHLATEDDFTAALILLYGDSDNCTMTLDGLEAMAEDLSIGVSAHDHSHGVSSRQKESKFMQKLRQKLLKFLHGADMSSVLDRFSKNQVQNIRSRVEVESVLQKMNDSHDDDHGSHVDHTCYSVEELLISFNLTDQIQQGLSKGQFENLCPALLQQTLQGCAEHSDSHSSSSSPSSLETYGLGTLVTLLVSACSLFGLVVYRWRDTDAYQYLICTMLGLAVGALVGDAILHLGPAALGVHSHTAGDDHDHDHSHEEGIVVEDYVWKMVLCVLAIWVFFMLQMGLEYSNRKEQGDKKVERGNDNKAFTVSNGDLTDLKSTQENSRYSQNQDQLTHPEGKTVIKDKSVAWMVTVGDSVHNFADGLAIGTSFAIDVNTGMATFLAVLFHELPHEFGDIAALLASGWSVKKVALVNFFSACTALLGLYIGIPVSTALDAESWILGAAMGMFLYVGLANILPELMENFRRRPSIKIAVAANVGIFFGFLVMLLIAIFEDHISV